MSSTVRRYAIKTFLVLAAVIGLGAGGSTLYAYGQSVGRDQVAEVLDAGVVDAGQAFDPAKPEEASPTAVQVPRASSSPGGLFEVSKDARKVGGLWLMIVVLLFAVAAEIRQRTAPKPGEEGEKIDPKSWRARSYAISSGVAAIAATLVDIGFGGVGWSALALPVAFAVGRVMDAINPPKGAKAKPAAGATTA